MFMSAPAELDRSKVVDIDLGSAEFKANAHRHVAEWARRPPFYVLGQGQPQVIVGRHADVHQVFSDTETFGSEMPRGPGDISYRITPIPSALRARTAARKTAAPSASPPKPPDSAIRWRAWACCATSASA